MNDLPPGYTYKEESLSDGSRLILIKEVKDELSAKVRF